MPPNPSPLRASQSRRRASPTVDTAIDTYAMTNLFPRTTGLPLTVWVSPRGLARHAARIKVSLTHGKMDIENVAVVAIRPTPRLVTGKLATSDLGAIARWITLNETALLDFWNETIDSIELGAKLKRLEQRD
jgi:hypothetical protein